MRYFSIFFLFAFLIVACSSPDPDQESQSVQSDQPEITEINAPDTDKYEESKVYVDSIKSTNQGVLISGNLPDGCSKLHEVSHTMRSDTLSINLTAWKPSEMMCTQALTPFDFVYKKVSQQQLNNASAITINGTSY